MYPYVACTDYSVVKIWNWDPLKGTVATLAGSVTETESLNFFLFKKELFILFFLEIHDISYNYFGQ